MVHEQGEMVDSIEANVETAQMRVEEGTSQLATAASYQVISPRNIYLRIHFSVILTYGFISRREYGGENVL